jgi:hypothetical protein
MRRGGKSTNQDALRDALLAATMNAARSVREKVGDETLYAFALYTSGQNAFSYVIASANTEQALTRASRGNPGLADQLRWNACDWEWHELSPDSWTIELPEGVSKARDRRLKKIFFDVLRAVDSSGVLGLPRPTLALMCGDMSEDFLLDSIAQLNPPEVVARYRAENTPATFLDELARLPPPMQLDQLVELYRDLSLRASTLATQHAQAGNVNEFTLEKPLVTFGLSATKRLIALADSVVRAPAFHAKGSDGWKRDGAFTREHTLATNAIRLAARTGLSDDDVASLQLILARRLEIDRDVKGSVSLVPVVIARALHAHAPKRFPLPKQGASNNRLGNAERFLETTLSGERSATATPKRAPRSAGPARSTRSPRR